MPKHRQPGIVHYGMLEEGSDYQLTVLPFYREQAAKTIQMAFRQSRIAPEHRHAFFSSKIVDQMDEHFNRTVCEHIQNNRYDLLPYNHPNFTRCLFSTLRANVINMNEFITAKLMYDSLPLFNQGIIPDNPSTQFTKFSILDCTGPYQVSSIAYWTRGNTSQLYYELRESAVREKYHYYTINFNYNQALMFLFAKLNQKQVNVNEGLIQFIRDYAALKSWTTDQKQFFLDEVIKLKNGFLTSTEQIKQFIKAVEPEFVEYMRVSPLKEYKNMKFLANIDLFSSQIPVFGRSPQYDNKNPSSPLFCFILPTMDTFNKLQEITHGNEACRPVAVVGKVHTRMIRAYDELPAITPGSSLTTTQQGLKLLFPTVSHLRTHSRPVELSHPDVERTTTAHGYLCDDFLLSWHDLFHTWRNGSNFKPLLRQLRQLHDEKMGLTQDMSGMSTIIWPLSDMDLSDGYMIRSNPDLPIYKILAIIHLLNIGGFDFSTSTDNNFLILFALCKHPSKWKQLLFGHNPLQFEDLLLQLHTHPEEKAMLTQIIAVQKKVLSQLNKNPEASIIDVILRALLVPPQESDDELIDLVSSKGYKTMFYWAKDSRSNQGLHFKAEHQEQLVTLRIVPRLRANTADAIRAGLKSLIQIPTIDQSCSL